MKKGLSFLFCSLLLPFSYATNLTAISSQKDKQQQKINIIFDTAPNLARVFIAGNDLVVDFYGLSNPLGKNQYMFESGLIHEVDVVVVDKRMRLLFLGGAKYKYLSVTTANSYSLIFSDGLVSPEIGKENVGLINLNKTSTTANYTTHATGLKFSLDDNGGGIIEIPYSGDTRMEIKDERIGNNLVVKLSALSYSPDLLKRIDASDFGTPVKYINTKAGNNSLTLTIENRNSWDYALYQLQGKLLINVRKLNKDSHGAIPSLNGNKADRVSFNFQNIDVRALLQLLADFSGYNILVSDSVSGTMSLKLNNVPWDQALNLILNAKGLAMKRDGNVIRIAPSAELTSLSRQEEDNQKSQEAVEPLDTATIRLKYSQAATVQAMIQQRSSGSSNSPGAPGSNPLNSPNIATTPANNASLTMAGNGLLSNRGTILVDTRTNTLIINDMPSRLKEIKELVDKIDIPVKQVLIEARIVEASSNFEKDLGTRLLLAGVGGSLTYANTLENGVTINQNGINSMSTAPTTYVNQNFGVSTGASMSTIFTPNSNTLIGLEVDALELQAQGRTISSPKVMTANYQPANIQQGVQIPYQQASSAGNTNVAFVNATLSLQVTPQITDDGYILLNVSIQKDTPSTTLEVQGTPAIDTNSVTTQVRVKDGSTILVGGIYIDDQQKVLEQVPLLGDIPYLGWLFKSQSTKNNKKELLIFITPRIIANSLENDN